MQNKNTVELVDWYGGDKAIARAAWTSTQIDINKKSDEEIGDLIINKLWKNKTGKPHKTPFERGIIEVNITCEQPSHIHLLKHRLANINGESARYKELKEDKFYLPEDFKNVEVSNNNIRINESYSANNWYEVLENISNLTNNLYHECLKDATEQLGRKRAKESARYFKTMNSQLTLSVMMNMSCFYNFYSLRADTAAQKEIQYIAQDMLSCIKNIEGNPFKHTINAFGL